jgi:hypothetical protein
MKRLLFGSFLLLLFVCSVLQCQELTVQTEGRKQTLSRADLEALPHVKVTASEHTSAPVSFEGVTLKSVLEKAGVTFGEAIRGKRLASCLLVEAADGYRVVIALPELDPAFTDKQVVLALLRDGKPLNDKEGPYRIVIPDEKRVLSENLEHPLISLKVLILGNSGYPQWGARERLDQTAGVARLPRVPARNR